MKYEHQLLNTRENSHGDYTGTAELSQRMKAWIRDQPGWVKLRVVQQESLDLIAMKIARILSGDPEEVDHWDDIAGYAQLVIEQPKVQEEAGMTAALLPADYEPRHSAINWHKG